MSLLALALATAAPPLTICADRPSKANSTCTVPTGRWQLEASGLDWMRNDDAHITTIGQMFVKYGLSGVSDLEVGVTPYQRVSGGGQHASGIGDTIVRYKQRLTGDDAPVQVGLIPFVKLPTAKHDLGNGKVEGGLIAPVSVATKAGVTVTFGPELDVSADSDGHGYHLGVTNLINLGVSAAPKLSLSAELWNNVNFDPAGTVRQWSLDGCAAFLGSDRVQLDAGANFGLNRATPDVELYAGASILF